MTALAYLHPLTQAAPAAPAEPSAHAADPSAHAADPDEVAAVRAALSGNLRARLQLGTRALIAILSDPEDTRQVFTLFLVANARSIPGFIARFACEPGGVALLSEKPAIDSRSVDFAALERLSPDTLGGAFARHLSSRGLSPDIFHAPPGVEGPLAYVGQRMRQCHDIWHVLTGYDTTVDDEIALLAFSYAQARLPGPALLAVLGAVRMAHRHPGVFRKLLDGYRRGKASRSLLTARWEDMWEEPLAVVRARFAIPPARA